MALPSVEPALPPTKSGQKGSTYGQILKSSALIGGSSVVNISIGIVRTKAMALLLGTGGVGLMGLYGSLLELTQSIAGMGINSSGVRQIAEAVGSGETRRIARTAFVLKRTAIVVGLLGAILLIAFARPLSVLTFGNDQNTAAIRVLSLAVFFASVAGGQAALIQGMRRISDLAKMGVLGALFGAGISICLIYFFREEGIVPSLVGIAAMAILTSWWFSRKVRIEAHPLMLHEVRQEASALLKLGFAFMASGVLTTGAAYLIRLIVLRKISLEAAGLYQSAWAIGGLYVGLILQAMGADFYPRLTAVAKDNAECNRLVNEQAQISLLLASPGVIGTLTFAPLVIAIFYTTKFVPAVEILRWICLGMALRVIAWPMGYIVLAKGVQKIFFWTEVAATIVHVALAWLFIENFGLAGAGMAFFGLYVWHGFLIYFIVRRLSGFHWSVANRKLGLLTLTLVGLVFCGIVFLPFWLATTIGFLAAVGSGIYSVRHLLKLVPIERFPSPVRRLLTLFRFVTQDSR
ncbi:MAG: O-antigen translocase [Verrucomicrobia bacterium]|nr:O-antigen translocase [Verrucomicrobiota bacterium]